MKSHIYYLHAWIRLWNTRNVDCFPFRKHWKSTYSVLIKILLLRQTQLKQAGYFFIPKKKTLYSLCLGYKIRLNDTVGWLFSSRLRAQVAWLLSNRFSLASPYYLVMCPRSTCSQVGHTSTFGCYSIFHIFKHKWMQCHDYICTWSHFNYKSSIVLSYLSVLFKISLYAVMWYFHLDAQVKFNR